MQGNYDIIVVGAGHAGCEAAAAAAHMGSRVLLVTMNMNTIAQMSCNPAMGGVAKGQIIREIDALGGQSGRITDETMIQFRMLNRSKGPAMWSPRAQSDRLRFAEQWRLTLESIPGVDFWQETVTELLVQHDRITGIKTGMGISFHAPSVILTNGTFLNGVIHIGQKMFGGGRSGERSVRGLTEQLVSLGFASGRMKTGTPPRVDGRSLNFHAMTEQPGDETPFTFSYLPDTKPLSQQRSCWITYTNPDVHDILKDGFAHSPMFNGRIQGLGPRYCPSIEDKINRFAERDRHQIFVEPEGWQTIEMYVNGFSTSLPEDIQFKALRQIPGFEQAKMFRPGYAIEYDFFPPTQLHLSLETKRIHGLFFAGQINGTTGYEEAACQGLIAGINAHRLLQDDEPLVLRRAEAYIGVLIDDLVNKGTEEPYRMFTSRAEYRLTLRQDNADLRLTPIGKKLGLASDQREELLLHKQRQINHLAAELRKIRLTPEDCNHVLTSIHQSPLKEKVSIHALLKRPGISLAHLENVGDIDQLLNKYHPEVINQVEILIKYDTYIQREHELAEKFNRLEKLKISPSFDYRQIPSLSAEAKEKLLHIQPETLGQASRISGVSPADLSVLMVYLGR